MSVPTFESLRDDIEGLQTAAGEARNLRWLVASLAVARNAAGDYEIFVRGDKLSAASSLVRRHLQHGDWLPRGGGEPFSANRIVLPSGPHFSSVAALIAVELLRAGLGAQADAQTAFSDVEPIIEMAIRRGALPENVVIGLLGELLVLRQCLLGAQQSDRANVAEVWWGWQPGRDFKFGVDSVEVKTTQLVNSIHEFSGLNQIEEAPVEPNVEENLYVLSIGMIASNSMGESLPVVVDQILGMLDAGSQATQVQSRFLRRVEAYGAAGGTGYRHATMRDWSAYSTRYTLTFPPRLYRVRDPAMRLLRRDEVAATFVDPASLTFTLHLPSEVSAFNPLPNWQEELRRMVSSQLA